MRNQNIIQNDQAINQNYMNILGKSRKQPQMQMTKEFFQGESQSHEIYYRDYDNQIKQLENNSSLILKEQQQQEEENLKNESSLFQKKLQEEKNSNMNSHIWIKQNQMPGQISLKCNRIFLGGFQKRLKSNQNENVYFNSKHIDKKSIFQKPVYFQRQITQPFPQNNQIKPIEQIKQKYLEQKDNLTQKIDIKNKYYEKQIEQMRQQRRYKGDYNINSNENNTNYDELKKIDYFFQLAATVNDVKKRHGLVKQGQKNYNQQNNWPQTRSQSSLKPITQPKTTQNKNKSNKDLRNLVLQSSSVLKNSQQQSQSMGDFYPQTNKSTTKQKFYQSTNNNNSIKQDKKKNFKNNEQQLFQSHQQQNNEKESQFNLQNSNNFDQIKQQLQKYYYSVQ